MEVGRQREAERVLLPPTVEVVEAEGAAHRPRTGSQWGGERPSLIDKVCQEITMPA